MSPAIPLPGVGVPRLVWKYGPLGCLDFGAWHVYNLLFVVPFTRGRVSVQWQIVVFDA